MTRIYTLFFFSFFTGTTIVAPKNNMSITTVPSTAEVTSNSDTLLYSGENFQFARKAFNFYSEKVDTAILIQLIKVCDHYKLNKFNDFKMCVGQMLVETGGNHYKNGRLVVGSGGHIGLTQISPTSGLAIMKKLVTSDDFQNFKVLTNDTTLVKPSNHSESVKFLSNVKNNLTFWGYIMNKNMKGGCSIESALVKYNAGPGGYQNYVNGGGSVSNHHYIRKIKNKLSAIK